MTIAYSVNFQLLTFNFQLSNFPIYLYQMEKKPNQPPANNLFGRENYIWIASGLAVIGLGLILMSGGKSNDPNVFNPKEVYSFTRITLAPILILLGLAMEVFAIFRKPKKG
jgi:hypothetical protein